MKFIIDARVGKKVEEILKIKGRDVKSILDINPASADLSILQLAITEKRIIITMDKDLENWYFIQACIMKVFCCLALKQ
jgi:predicted nuclease of predicted toxin-antitoxin system